MSNPPTSLDDLRRRIDALDDQLHDVLMQRAAIVAEVAQRKQADSTPPMRPGREAQILRRLVGRHSGAFPKTLLVRIWRELLSGTTSLQAVLHVAVFAPNQGGGFWDLARDQYGSHTPMTGFRTAGDVVTAVSDGRAALGVLPVPGQSNEEAWWRFFAAGDSTKPRIVARLPFGGRGNARTEGDDAFVIGSFEPEESGSDRSVFLIETGEGLSRARLLSALSGVTGTPTLLAAINTEGGAASQLFEFDGWLAENDQRLKDALAALGDKVMRVALLGAYAKPFTAAELATEPTP
jgi:chorismate mutase